MRDVTILMDTTQGKPAHLLTDLAEAGVRVHAGCLFPRIEGRVAHIAVADEDVEQVTRAAAKLGATVGDVRDCVVVPHDYDGGAPEVAAKVGKAGVTVHVAYFGARGEIILATSEIEEAREALGL